MVSRWYIYTVQVCPTLSYGRRFISHWSITGQRFISHWTASYLSSVMQSATVSSISCIHSFLSNMIIWFIQVEQSNQSDHTRLTYDIVSIYCFFQFIQIYSFSLTNSLATSMIMRLGSPWSSLGPLRSRLSFLMKKEIDCSVTAIKCGWNVSLKTCLADDPLLSKKLGKFNRSMCLLSKICPNLLVIGLKRPTRCVPMSRLRPVSDTLVVFPGRWRNCCVTIKKSFTSLSSWYEMEAYWCKLILILITGHRY